MPMDNEELTEAMLELRDAFYIVSAGCEELAAAIGIQTRLLVEIREAVTAAPEGPNPIVTLLQSLVELAEANALALAHVEKGARR